MIDYSKILGYNNRYISPSLDLVIKQNFYKIEIDSKSSAVFLGKQCSKLFWILNPKMFVMNVKCLTNNQYLDWFSIRSRFYFTNIKYFVRMILENCKLNKSIKDWILIYQSIKSTNEIEIVEEKILFTYNPKKKKIIIIKSSSTNTTIKTELTFISQKVRSYLNLFNNLNHSHLPFFQLSFSSKSIMIKLIKLQQSNLQQSWL